MRIVAYTDVHAQSLASAIARADFDVPLLTQPAFVQHYFLDNPECRLHLLLDENEEVLATLGSERIVLQVGDDLQAAAVCSNTYSFRPGAIAFLFFHWMRSTKIGIAFPGNASFTALLARQERWRALHGLHVYYLNWDYPSQPSDALWKRALRPAVRLARRVDASAFPLRIAAERQDDLRVLEVDQVGEDMLPTRTPFGLRLAPDIDHLRWRFDSRLPHIRYRVFKIFRGPIVSGYVVIAEWEFCLLVSHCDGADPDVVAFGVLSTIATLNQGSQRYRKVLLSTSHARMSAVFRRFGFQPKDEEIPVYMTREESRRVNAPSTQDWLLNLDLGDIGTVLGLVYNP